MANPVAAGWALSYANRVDGRIHLSVHLPNYGLETSREGARIKVVNGKQSIVAPATITELDGRLMLESTLPPDDYRNGLWELSVCAPKGSPFREAVARICIAEPNPISLLVIPKMKSYVPAARHTLSTKQRAAHSLGLVADRVLAELPPAQAARVRAKLRRTARKVLSR
jgi:hypothetical protein